MNLSYALVRSKLSRWGLWPTSRVAWGAWYALGLALFLWLLQSLLSALKLFSGESLGWWVGFLSFISILFFAVLAFRWLKAKLLWRLRNRLIVAYVFIGVVPAILLIAMASATLYLLAGQFANFIVTSEIHLHLHSVEAVNSAIAHELAAKLERGESPTMELLDNLRKTEVIWKHRDVCAWQETKPLSVCGGAKGKTPFAFPSFIHGPFSEIVRDHGDLYLRTATVLPVRSGKLTVVSSEPLDQELVQEIAANLGEITLYTVGLDLRGPSNTHAPDSAPAKSASDSNSAGPGVVVRESKSQIAVESGGDVPHATFTAGALPAAANTFDHQITFGTPLPVVDWETGTHEQRAPLVRVQTRPSVLYSRLFAALGDFAKGVEFILLGIAIVLAIIALLALVIGGSLTRFITGAVAQLYKATQHVDRGDFSHRIPVKSSDQLAELANSFNTMTASIERLVLEQKEKQRLENELVIAQEVQAQLFPREISQLESLEVHGFCRPARTVSGDYYDFLTINSEKLILAAGDVSGKGISAALLMATIHSAVRAYSMVGIPVLREPIAVGAGAGSGMMLASGAEGVEVSPGTLLALLNHQLYESTPQEKYATLFLAIYDGGSRKLTYSNGGHLPPVIMSQDGSIRRLDQGGMVVGLFDNLSFDEASVNLNPGDVFLAYSDGVTEPENDFGEFGEERLIDLVRENRDLPLLEITELVTSAVDDWIGDKEQPDDITLVLARTR
ncbi:MAG TPA: SpoIIE family protein phosphatase [Terriglobales bacterium]|nr:SpoIIE family protein phosphatase [Terriglobales bacterium]